MRRETRIQKSLGASTVTPSAFHALGVHREGQTLRQGAQVVLVRQEQLALPAQVLIIRADHTQEPRLGPERHAAASLGPILVPTWEPGSEWTYWWESPRGSGTFVWIVDREQTIEGTIYCVVKSGPTREAYYRKADLAWRMDRVNGAVESKSTPEHAR
jgi:hypothetical protein